MYAYSSAAFADRGEPVHLALVPGLERAVVAVPDVHLESVDRGCEGSRLAPVHPDRDAVRAREQAEHVVEGPVLLDHEHDVLDRRRRLERFRIDGRRSDPVVERWERGPLGAVVPARAAHHREQQDEGERAQGCLRHRCATLSHLPLETVARSPSHRDDATGPVHESKEGDMRRFVTVVWITLMGVLAAGLTSAVAATGIAQEETIVLGEHTLKGRNLDLVGEADDFRPGDRYIFRSELTDGLGCGRRSPVRRLLRAVRQAGLLLADLRHPRSRDRHGRGADPGRRAPPRGHVGPRDHGRHR